MKGTEEVAVRYERADLEEPADAAAVVAMVDRYARDPMGGGEPLSGEARGRLIAGLRAMPTTEIVLAWAGTEAVGVAVCFRGFSTFAARPNLNLHDVSVVPAWRGKGVGRGLLAAVEARARELGCRKLTLEVLDRNARAMRVYQDFGFRRYALRPEAGEAIFLTKELEERVTSGG